ncbi:hypothetical protein [Alteromonas sp. ASW11-130]|uniref:hypothetical protein n=1 Tax=Alteromonas sp. ASW11-130 TaxID=3015775 RepID=UPI002242A5FC|nr:hypothetical protein [Alteromonas sp. ASW11-130]MCW8091592.1 hypothetical protein [Alteromonas sp. ASW11-130]
MFSRSQQMKVDMGEASRGMREVGGDSTNCKFVQAPVSASGKAISATQEQCSVTANDNLLQYIKKARVVSTIEYTLVD